MQVVDLLKLKKINDFEYKAYLLFYLNDQGAQFIKNAFEGVSMEEPMSLDSECAFSWMDGRRSIWRDIKIAINKVNYLLENVDE